MTGSVRRRGRLCGVIVLCGWAAVQVPDTWAEEKLTVRTTTMLEVKIYRAASFTGFVCALCNAGNFYESSGHKLFPGRGYDLPAHDHLGVEYQGSRDPDEPARLEGLVRFIRQYRVRRITLRNCTFSAEQLRGLWSIEGLTWMGMHGCETKGAAGQGVGLPEAKTLATLWVDDDRDRTPEGVLREMIERAPRLAGLRLGFRRWSADLLACVARRQGVRCLDVTGARGIRLDEALCRQLAGLKLKHLIATWVPMDLAGIGLLDELEELCVEFPSGAVSASAGVELDALRLAGLKHLKRVHLPEPWASALKRRRPDVEIVR